MTGEAAGCLREELTVSADQVFEIPASIPMRDAAVLPVAYGTAARALLNRAQAKSGESLVALGAARGMGMAAPQIGKALGMRVIAAAGSEARIAFAIERGADAGIDYTREPLRERVRDLTAGRGEDVIVDPVGGALIERCLRSLAWCGRLLVVGFTSGLVPSVAANQLLLKSASVLGVFYDAFARCDPERNRELLSRVVRWYQQGSIRPRSITP